MSASISINSAIYQKLQTIAAARNCQLRDCLEQALNEYIDNCEQNDRSETEALDCSERAYFLSVAE